MAAVAVSAKPQSRPGGLLGARGPGPGPGAGARAGARGRGPGPRPRLYPKSEYWPPPPVDRRHCWRVLKSFMPNLFYVVILLLKDAESDQEDLSALQLRDAVAAALALGKPQGHRPTQQM